MKPALVLAAIATCVPIAACSKADANDGSSRPYKVGVVDREVRVVVEETGVVSPERSIIVKSPISGVVQQLYVREGDQVQKGQVLARILPDMAQANSLAQMRSEIAGGWNAVMFTIAGVTLIVGGIGLFSVLLISVRERVHEIGIRKALGADDGAIMRLFLAESLTLAFLGAVLGIAGGAGLTVITELIGRQFGKPFAIPVNVPGVALAVIFALIVGLLFGWYPARRAARLDPIEAIIGA